MLKENEKFYRDLSLRMFSILRQYYETDDEFAQVLEISRVTACNYRNAEHKIPVTAISIVHHKYNISYDWLIDGNEIATSYFDSLYASLSQEHQKMVIEHMKGLQALEEKYKNV